MRAPQAPPIQLKSLRLNLFRQRSTRGFTLVEVTLAIGIVAFAMIGMLGLLPFGLNSFQEASTLNTQSLIVQAVSSELARTDVANIDLGPRYFDNEGNALSSAQKDAALFTATVAMDDFSQLSALNVDQESGKRLTISVNCLRTENARGPVTFPLLIPNS